MRKKAAQVTDGFVRSKNGPPHFKVTTCAALKYFFEVISDFLLEHPSPINQAGFSSECICSSGSAVRGRVTWLYRRAALEALRAAVTQLRALSCVSGWRGGESHVCLVLLHSLHRRNHARFLGCTSFGLRAALHKRRSGWFHLLSKEVGIKKHVKAMDVGAYKVESRGRRNSYLKSVCKSEEQLVVSTPWLDAKFDECSVVASLDASF